MRGLRARWLDSMDHDEIREQLKGEAASTFAYVNPEFGCPLRTQISGAYSSVEMNTAQAWSGTMRALSALSLRKPKIHTNLNASEGKGGLCQPCYNDALRPADRFHSFHSIASLGIHVNRAHSSATTPLSPLYCPYVECKTTLEQGKLQKDHLATVHNLNL